MNTDVGSVAHGSHGRGELPPVRDIASNNAMRMEAHPFPDWAVILGGHLWVSGVEPGLARFDVATGQRQGGIPLADVCLAMDAGFDSVWAGSCNPGKPTLSRVDASTGQLVTRIQLPAGALVPESSVGAGEGYVWVLASSEPGRLLVIDPITDTVVDQIPAPHNAAAVRVGLGGVWVSTSAPGAVVRLDPRTGEVDATIPVGVGPRFLALGAGAVWVMNQLDGTVCRIDPEFNRVVATIKVSSSVIDGGDIAATDRAVWVRVTDALVTCIDPLTNQSVDRVGPPAGSGSVAIADDSVWITAHDVQALWRLPVTNFGTRPVLRPAQI